MIKFARKVVADGRQTLETQTLLFQLFASEKTMASPYSSVDDLAGNRKSEWNENLYLEYMDKNSELLKKEVPSQN